MKKIFLSILAISAIVFSACNNNKTKNEEEGHNKNKDTMQHTTTVANEKDVKTVAVTYTKIDAKAASSIKEIMDHYLHIKNALIADNGKEAARGGKAMEEAINKLDKSLLTADQKKIYDEIEEELQEHADHIGKYGDNIIHQRQYFSKMSEDIYDLVKAFGGGRPLYHDHCPMYNENNGAIWLSEMKEIKNPYFGAQMPACGSVKEVIK